MCQRFAVNARMCSSEQEYHVKPLRLYICVCSALNKNRHLLFIVWASVRMRVEYMTTDTHTALVVCLSVLLLLQRSRTALFKD